MTPESSLLLRLAAAVAEAHRAVPSARAAMVTGSVAKGLADGISDIDMAIYYEATLPDDDALGTIAGQLGATGRRPLGGPREEQAFIEAFDLAGVEVQLIHSTISGWEQTMDDLLVRHAVSTPLAKALEGILCCKALYGEALIEGWRARAADLPHALAVAMVRHYLSFFPAWGVPGQMLRRDPGVWYRQILVETAQNTLGVLAGLSRVYYTPFQHKRLRRFVTGLSVAPPDLADRLEALFTLPVPEALPALEALVGEVVALVEQHMPEVDTSAVRRRLGWRKPNWEADAVACWLGSR